jgi:hypothetical protein
MPFPAETERPYLEYGREEAPNTNRRMDGSEKAVFHQMHAVSCRFRSEQKCLFETMERKEPEEEA